MTIGARLEDTDEWARSCPGASREVLLFKVAPFLLGAVLTVGLLASSWSSLPSLQMSSAAAASFDCSEARSAWPRRQASWCCHAVGRGCDVEKAMDCVTGFSRWRELWPPERQRYCCEQHSVACEDSPAAEADDWGCEEGGDVRSWPAEKARWCCEHMQLACASEGSGPSTTTEFHDCQKDFATWPTSWGVRKKAWCCQHERVACPTLRSTSAPQASRLVAAPPPAALVSGKPSSLDRSPDSVCEALCEYSGVRSSCSGHIKALASGKFSSSPDACSQAVDEVFRHCPRCGGCRRAAERCTSPMEFDCADDGLQSSAWSSEQRRWCCLHRGVACAASAAYNCSEGSPSQREWQMERKAWCCIHAGRACPPKAAMEQLPFANMSYDCEKDLERWETVWSVAKRAWCCISHKKGCDQ